jgi:protein SCO1/2
VRRAKTAPAHGVRAVVAAALAAAAASLPAPAGAYFKHKGPLPAVGGEGQFAEADINVIENLGQKIPRGLAFVDGHGQRVALDGLLDRDKPVLVTLGYYRCIQLCNLVHEGLAKAIKASGLKLGRDFLGVAVSVDPKEEAKTAATNEGRLHRALGSSSPETWPFLLPAGGDDAAARALSAAIGFKYKYDEKSKQFAHAAVAVLLTPEGKIARYLYGVDFAPRDMRMAVVESGGGRVGTTLDRVLLTCFKYDPMTQRYTPYAVGFVRIGAGLSGLALLALLAILWRREIQLRRSRRAA